MYEKVFLPDRYQPVDTLLGDQLVEYMANHAFWPFCPYALISAVGVFLDGN